MDQYELEDVVEICVSTVEGEPIIFQGEGIYVLRDWLNSVLDEPSPSRKKGKSTRRRAATKVVERPSEEYSDEYSSEEEVPAKNGKFSARVPKSYSDRGGYSSMGVKYQKGSGTAASIAAQMKAQAEKSNIQF